MVTSDAINELATALAKAQATMGGAKKDSSNPFFHSKYADLASIWEACRDPLTQHGLAVIQFPKTEYVGTPELVEFVTKSGDKRTSVQVLCVVSVLTRIVHQSGQFIEETVSAMLGSGDPQAVGSAVTYLRRYALQSCVGVAPEDDDAEATVRRSIASEQRAVKVPPVGFEDWMTEMANIAGMGRDRLQQAWQESSTIYRKYVLTTDPERWERLKALAGSVPSTSPC